MSYFLRQKRLQLSALSGAIRVLLLILAVWMYRGTGRPLAEIGLVFVWAEIGLFIFQLSFCLKHLVSPTTVHALKSEMIRHFHFGRRAVLGGIIYEFNTKIDIFILTFYVGRELLGVYSFAATLASGYVQLIALFKNMNTKNLSTIISSQNKSMDFMEAPSFRKIMWFFYGVAGLTTMSYIPFTYLVTHDPGIVYQGFWVYCLYMIGFGIATKYLLLDNVLILSKNPLTDSFLRASIVCLNFLLSICFIPWLGIYGAALSVVFSILFNAWWIRRYVLQTIPKITRVSC